MRSSLLVRSDPVDYRDPYGLCAEGESERIIYSPQENGDWSAVRLCDGGTGRWFMERTFTVGHKSLMTALYGVARAAPAINSAVAGFLPATGAAALGGAAAMAGGELASLGLSGWGGPVVLYRGVSAAEAAQIAATGALQLGPAGTAVKYFTNTVQAAEKWAQQYGPGSRVVQVQIPWTSVRGFDYLGRIDGIGYAWTARMDQLNNAIVRFLR
jgi:hypothetical protein